ncbi:hypothetical protein K0V07_11440 [Ruficoccus sp. ZRK36]|nr:DUF3644 domain-containing protein [Ruficoccus sp. ZRK36]QYY34915.1 hypothetical protein K0V07_11440 [Ruficoccus sp. ZRK36]
MAFKAILSKNKIRIFKPKERDRPYMTLGLLESVDEAKRHFPSGIEFKPVSENIGRLVDYRNNAVHFYNEAGFEALIYGLAQTSIVNYRDVISACFGRDIASEVNISLLPLSFGATPDPIQFLGSTDNNNQKPAVSEFLKIISDTTAELEKGGFDTGRFLTVFQVNLQSTKKVQSADIVAGIKGDSSNGVLLVSKKIDPNKSHPLNRKKVLDKIDKDHRGAIFNERTFDALVWKHKLKDKGNLCWKNESIGTYQYSPEIVSVLKAYTKEQINNARLEYSDHQRLKRYGPV